MKKFLLSDKKSYQIGFRILRWYFQRYILSNPQPLIVAVFTTNVCNLKCEICSIWRGLPKATLSLEQIKNVVDAVKDTACYISFSGGEPLTVPDILPMISYASQRIPYVHLVSNGLLVSRSLARQLQQAGLTEVSLSLDGQAPWHNKTHGNDKSFEAVMNAIEYFKIEAPSVHLGLDTVIYPEALDETKKAVIISEKLGIFHKVQPPNKHFEFRDCLGKPSELDFSSVDYKALDELIDYLIHSPHVLSSRYFLRHIPDYFKNQLQCQPCRPKCLLPYFFLEVNAFGKVSPCMYATGWEAVADIDAKMRNTLESAEYRQCQEKLQRCKLCDKSMFLCYWEPLIQFPLTHAFTYGLRK